MKRFIRIDLEYEHDDSMRLYEMSQDIKKLLEKVEKFSELRVINVRDTPTLGELNDVFYRKCDGI